jgi:3-hexulose-6-phosphate synthase/6-phospho-3-hexuloisomerase
MDTGALETEMAAKAGADVICILGAADNATISEAVRSAKRYGSKIMVDLIGVKDKIARAKEIEKFGADYLCLHVGIDEQMMGKKPFDFISSIVNETNLPVAVAGGLNSETVAYAVKAGAKIIIVGGAIIKAQNVTEATKIIRKALDELKPIVSKLYKKYDKTELKKAFSMVSTPNICDAMHTSGAMHGIRPIKPGFHMVGKAITVRTINGDWAKPIEAIDKANSENVIVVDVNGGDIAIWGELATRSAMKKGIAGVVIDGAVRDLDDLLQLDFPIFCRHISSDAGEPKGFGEIGAEIKCGGIKVRNGDWIIGDDSGVVVVPQEIAQEIANRALDIKERENRIREEIERGSSLGKVLNVKKWEKIIG